MALKYPIQPRKFTRFPRKRHKSIGVSLEEALTKFNKSLENTTFLVGHNIRFDMNALGAEFIRAGFESRFLEMKQVCTMWSSTDHMKLPGGRGGKFKPPKLMELYEFLFEEQFPEAHNASADVEATARCFL